MNTYKITAGNTSTKIKAQVKSEMTALLIEFLTEKFGEENVKMLRTGNGDSKTNEIGIRYGIADKNGETTDITVKLNPAVAEFETRSTAKKSYVAFDFDAAADAYDDYLEEKAEKEAERKAKKNAD